jgi:pumilio family protein 6
LENVEDVEKEESDPEEIPKITDGLHPERAKAVVTNSENSDSSLRIPD